MELRVTYQIISKTSTFLNNNNNNSNSKGAEKATKKSSISTNQFQRVLVISIQRVKYIFNKKASTITFICSVVVILYQDKMTILEELVLLSFRM